jgi:hypothetical protein
MTSTSTPARRRRLPKRTVAVAAAVAGASALSMMLTASPASADPYSTLAAVGSDTTQYAMNGLSQAAAPGLLASYDAIDPGSLYTRGSVPNATGVSQDNYIRIKPKALASSFPRPNGSGDGTKALAAAHGGTPGAPWSGITDGTPNEFAVDIARAS